MKLADGTWRVFGATSTTNSPACASLGTWALIHPNVAWVEQQSGVDITPCFDAASGAWQPGPKCSGVPLNPEVTDGTWPNLCTEQLMLSGPLASCGGATDAGPPVVDAQADARRNDSGAGVDAGSAGGRAGSGGGAGTSGGGAGAGGANATGGAGGNGGTGGNAGSAVATGGAGTGVTSTTTGSAGASTGRGGSAPVPTAAADDVGGCGCRVGSKSGDRASPVLLLMACGIVARMRRARRVRA